MRHKYIPFYSRQFLLEQDWGDQISTSFEDKVLLSDKQIRLLIERDGGPIKVFIEEWELNYHSLARVIAAFIDIPESKKNGYDIDNITETKQRVIFYESD